MLTISPITPNTENLGEVKGLYERAFPENERRPFRGLLTVPKSSAESVALYDEDLFCGFASFLNGKTMSHIIYLAIDENLRNWGYGSMALQALHAYKSGRRIMVDIELEKDAAPNNEQRRKRKQFYLRNGYEQTAIRYRWRREDYEILSYGGDVSEEEYEAFWEEL